MNEMLPRPSWHKRVTEEAILGAVGRRNTTLDNPGFCLACGLEHGGIEPDTRGYECEACGEPQVYGADELILEIA